MVCLCCCSRLSLNTRSTPRAAGRSLCRVLDSHKLTPEAVRRNLRELLDDPIYRANAVRIRREAADQPGPDDVVQDLEHVVAENSVDV